MRRTLRQEGLVDQRRLENLSIAVVSDGSNTSALRCAIDEIAGQLGAPAPLEYSGERRIHDFILCLGNTPVPQCSTPYARVQILDDGVRITSDNDAKGGLPSTIQEPGLCTVAASLAWQEVLRRTGVILPVEVPKKYITVNLRVDPSNLGQEGISDSALHLVGEGGEEFTFRTGSRDDGTGHVVLSFRLDEGTELADRVFDSIKLESTGSSQSYSAAEIELKIPRCEGAVCGSVTVAGVGGLGSWAMHTLAKGIVNSGEEGSGLSINLVDPDVEVEIHNLNRQVLYNGDDIGLPKAEVSATRIFEFLPLAKVQPYVCAIGLSHLDGIINQYNIIQNRGDEDVIAEIDLGDENCLEESVALLEALKSTDVVFCGVDNLRSRAVLSAISSHLGVPMINAGAKGFNGSFDIFLGNQTCMACRYGTQIVSHYRPMSCQEDGEVPFSSIVTSTALFGALEGLALISALSSGGSSLSDWPSQIIWSGWSNNFSCHRDHSFGPFKPALLPLGSHSEHLTGLLFDAEV